MTLIFNLIVETTVVAMILFAAPRVSAAQQEEIGFIKSLVRERLEQAGVFEQWRKEFEEMDNFMVMGTPEATLVTIVKSYLLLKANAWEDREIFRRIEDERRLLLGSAPLPSPLTLHRYVRHRIDLEHRHATVPLSDEFVARAIRKAVSHFSTPRERIPQAR